MEVFFLASVLGKETVLVESWAHIPVVSKAANANAKIFFIIFK